MVTSDTNVQNSNGTEVFPEDNVTFCNVTNDVTFGGGVVNGWSGGRSVGGYYISDQFYELSSFSNGDPNYNYQIKFDKVDNNTIDVSVKFMNPNGTVFTTKHVYFTH